MSVSAGSGLVFNGIVAANTAFVVPFEDLAQASMMSIQTISDGADTYTVEIQMSNVPALRDNYAAGVQLTPGVVTPCPPRNDSVNSNDWVTVSNNTLTAQAGGNSRIDTVAFTPHRVSRVRITPGSVGGAMRIYFRLQGTH